MKLVKNIHLIQDSLSESDINELKQDAYNYARHAQLYFKVIHFDDSELIVEARQFKSPNENYFTEKEMSERTRDLFNRVFPNHELKVRLSPYNAPAVDIVTPAWVQERMSKKRMASKAIRDLTGIDKGNISKWISGSRKMSQPVKAMFYLLLND
ncbi:hypothetical protein KUV50_06095 [Membranicola marinus]|uniref:Uncharacterized protein n=1 Tax=Membranihabitans marinus TaxID=1227546 RepID=A0A953HW87_9BACT|nr:hypothetical protein [Membranihabitans marinus]MBY5957691.1 hypothetical protein [Membranihabitans marinus]